MTRPLILALLFCACGSSFSAHAQADTDAAFDEVREEIVDLFEAKVQLWNLNDLKGFLRIYQQNESTRLFTIGGEVRGFEALQRKFENEYIAPRGKGMGKLQFRNLQVIPLGEGSAMARGIWQLLHGGSKQTGLFTMVLQKQDGEWQAIHEHVSEIVAEGNGSEHGAPAH